MSLYLSEVPQSTVETIMEVNALLHKVRDAAKHPMLIRPLGPPSEMVLVAWGQMWRTTIAETSSTAAIFVGASNRLISEGVLQ